MGTELKPKTMNELISCGETKSLIESLGLNDKQTQKAISAALTLNTNENLISCDRMSLLKYCLTTARYNFVRDESIYPVPYKNKVQAQIGYQGFRELALRTKRYSKIDCVEVKEKDRIKTNEDGEPIVKFYEDYQERMNSKTIGYYAYARNINGELVKTVYWTIEKIKEHAKKYSLTEKVWNSSFDRMAKKTIIKTLCKDLDITEELDEAIQQDQIVYGGLGERNIYADNPFNTETFVSKEEVKTKAKIDENQPKETIIEGSYIIKEENKENKKTSTPPNLNDNDNPFVEKKETKEVSKDALSDAIAKLNAKIKKKEESEAKETTTQTTTTISTPTNATESSKESGRAKFEQMLANLKKKQQNN